MTTSNRRDRRAERHAETKQEIVRAAWSAARERGVAGWSLRDVAEQVGMRGPSLYEYFDGKNALYDALFADGYRELLARIAAAEIDGEPVEMLRRAAHLMFDFSVEDPERFQLLFLRTIPGFTPSPDSYAQATNALDGLTEVLAAAGAHGPDAVALWTALLSGLASQQISNDPGGERWAKLVDTAVDMFLAQVRRGGAGPAKG